MISKYKKLYNSYVKIKQRGGTYNFIAKVILLPTFFNEIINFNDEKQTIIKDNMNSIDEMLNFLYNLENQPEQDVKTIQDIENTQNIIYNKTPQYNITDDVKNKVKLKNLSMMDNDIMDMFLRFIISNENNINGQINQYTRFDNNFLVSKLKSFVDFYLNDTFLHDDNWYFYKHDMNDIDVNTKEKFLGYLTKLKEYILKDEVIWRKEQNFNKRIIYGSYLDLSKAKNVIVIGDIHSSNTGFFSILNDLKDKDVFVDVNNSLKLKENNFLISTGDILDRGVYNIEIYLLFSILKLENPNNVYLIAGNHEEELFSKFWDSNASYEIVLETIHNIYKNKHHDDFNIEWYGEHKKYIYYLIELFLQITTLMPNVIFAKMPNDKIIQFCHGGIDIYMWNNISTYLNMDDKPPHFLLTISTKIQNYYDNAEQNASPGYGLLWSDFAINKTNLDENGRLQINKEQVNQYLEKNNISVIISGHQDMIPYAYLNKTDEIINEHILTQEIDEPLQQMINDPIVKNINFSNLENKVARIDVNNQILFHHIISSYKSYDLITHPHIINLNMECKEILLNENEFNSMAAIILSACVQAKSLSYSGYMILSYN